MNLVKIEKAKKLLQEGISYERIREIIGKEFPESISPSTLSQLNKELKNSIKEEDEKAHPLNPEMKEALKTMIELFKKAINIEAFTEMITERETNSVDRLEKVI